MKGHRDKKILWIMAVTLLLSAAAASGNSMSAYAVSDIAEPAENQSNDSEDADPEVGLGQYEAPAEGTEPEADGEKSTESEGAAEGTQISEEETAQQGDPEKEEGTTGSAFVEVDPEKLFDRELVDSIGRSGGTLREDVLFSAEPVTYQIRLSENASDLVVLTYRLGEQEGTVLVTEKTALIEVPAGISATLQILAGEGEMERLLFEEYLVIEQEQPMLTYERIRKEDGKQYVHVTAEDVGEILSGIGEWKCVVDGNAYLPEEIIGTEPYTLREGREISVKQELDVLLEGEEGHDIQIAVSDNAGNMASQTISMKALPEDVVSVSLPTYFYIAIRPYEIGENTQIYSDDVVVCNQSAFPVEVVVTSALVEINHTVPGEPVLAEPEKDPDGKAEGEGMNAPEGAPEGEDASMQEETPEGEGTSMQEEVPEYQKDCQIRLKLRQFEEEPLLLPLVEGTSENIISFSLAAGREETQLEALMGQRYLAGVEGGDYALLNVCGDLKEGSADMWRGGDLVVQLVFEFHRQEEDEE